MRVTPSPSSRAYSTAFVTSLNPSPPASPPLGRRGAGVVVKDKGRGDFKKVLVLHFGARPCRRGVVVQDFGRGRTAQQGEGHHKAGHIPTTLSEFAVGHHALAKGAPGRTGRTRNRQIASEGLQGSAKP